MVRFSGLVLVVAAGLLAVGVAHADVFNMPNGETSLVTVPVGDAGNCADTTGYGAVAYNYNIGKYDVTNAQYAEFLTAKATSSDPYGLWNSSMSSNAEGGISRSGSGPYTYYGQGREGKPAGGGGNLVRRDPVRQLAHQRAGQRRHGKRAPIRSRAAATTRARWQFQRRAARGLGGGWQDVLAPAQRERMV